MFKAFEKTRCLLFSVAALMLLAGIVSAAPTAELLTHPTSVDIDGAIYSTFDPDGAQGTGNFEPFVRVQVKDGEMGYNTDGDVEYATKSGIWTHSITLSEIPVVTNDDGQYLQFLLDTNQNKGGLLSIDQVVISLESAPNLTDYPEIDYQNFGGPVIYSLDSDTTDHTIITNPDLFGPGSGSGDVELLVPTSFIPDTDNQWLYLYTELGYYGEALSNAGFEEWGVLEAGPTTNIVPAPASVALGAIGMGLIRVLRKRKTL
ncbi:MAG: hypothetical protein ACYSUT_05110 [Planctomycetota bacterium]